jgi:hypothetical protein
MNTPLPCAICKTRRARRKSRLMSSTCTCTTRSLCDLRLVDFILRAVQYRASVGSVYRQLPPIPQTDSSTRKSVLGLKRSPEERTRRAAIGRFRPNASLVRASQRWPQWSGFQPVTG